MKKLLSILLVMMMLLASLAACGVLSTDNTSSRFKYTQGAQSGAARPNPTTGETGSYVYLMLSDTKVEDVDASVGVDFPVREAK